MAMMSHEVAGVTKSQVSRSRCIRTLKTRRVDPNQIADVRPSNQTSRIVDNEAIWWRIIRITDDDDDDDDEDWDDVED